MINYLMSKKWLVLSALVLIIALVTSIWIFTHKSNPKQYTFVFLGDSMTEYLGNFDELRADLNKYYPDQKFLLLNYGYSSTNILSAQDRIEKESSHSGRIFQPINNIPFDYIFIESFGHNPLSQYPLDQGLKMQNEALDKLIATISQKHPRSSIIFVATIAPNRDRYGEGVVNLTTEERQKWADERSAYIQNHINYAKSHGIPLVDIYDKSLKNGTGNIDYVNTNDFIHPSPTGIYFISQELADFIHSNKLLK